MKHRFLTVFFALLITSLLGCSKAPYANVSNSELESLLKENVTLIDIRRPEEWKQTGVVKGSHLITLFDGQGRLVESFFDKLGSVVKDKETPVVLICRTGNRTQAGSQMLVENLGFKTVYNVTNGITGWISEGREVEKR